MTTHHCGAGRRRQQDQSADDEGHQHAAHDELQGDTTLRVRHDDLLDRRR